MFTIEGVDTSYVQGDYKPMAEKFVFINASRANRGFLESGDYYHDQVDNARSAGKVVGHYFFLGNKNSPTECGNYFADNLYDFRDGDWLFLDTEDEPATSTIAWGPNQALEFILAVNAKVGVRPGVYMNLDLTKRFDWSIVVNEGSPLWLAQYAASPDDVKWWPSWLCWQYDDKPLDKDKMQIGC